MKKVNLEISTIFAVAREMVKGKGEDSLCYKYDGEDFIVAAFDGCGGSGSKKYENFSGMTGAYMASRAVCGGVTEWFAKSRTDETIVEYIQQALERCKAYGDRAGRIMGSLGKAFPTTAAIIRGTASKDKVSVTAYWAGDSRCYLLDEDGLHQITEDDLDGQDAMSNLYNDGVMTNVISASSPFDIHIKKFSVDRPCVLFSATDGCFGYLTSPMAFEQLVTSSLISAETVVDWQRNMYTKMGEIAGDDYTMTLAAFGFKTFEDMKMHFAPRNKYVAEKYLKPDADVNALWEEYKPEYSKYL